jgi:uncharacterized protein YbjT (DUF2867 family)
MVLVVEHYLASSGLDYTILQPSLFMESWPRSDALRRSGSGDREGLRESRRALPLRERERRRERGRAMREQSCGTKCRHPVGGPEALTQRDAVRLFEQGFG